MDYLHSNLASPDPTFKTTFRLKRHVKEYMDSLPDSTRNATLNRVFEALARQNRAIPGVGPLPLREFAGELGFDDTLPPEYRYTAKERELFRQERAKLVGAPRSWFEDVEPVQVEQLPEPVQVEQLPEPVQVEQLPEPVQVEQLPPVQMLKTVCEKQNKPRAVFGAIEEQEHPVDFAARAERVRELLELLAVCAPACLSRVQTDYPGLRPSVALERELATLVQIYAPVVPKAVKRRIWRDLS